MNATTLLLKRVGDELAMLPKRLNTLQADIKKIIDSLPNRTDSDAAEALLLGVKDLLAIDETKVLRISKAMTKHCAPTKRRCHGRYVTAGCHGGMTLTQIADGMNAVLKRLIMLNVFANTAAGILPNSSNFDATRSLKREPMSSKWPIVFNNAVK